MIVTQTKKLFVFLFAGLVISIAQSAQISSEPSTEPEMNVTQGMEDEATQDAMMEEEIQAPEPNLPEDTSPRLAVREIRISGNTLIPTEEIFKQMPDIYNASMQPLLKAESRYLYDFRNLRELISEPNQPQEVSTRTIEGLVKYILSLYQKKHYAGIYVYVPQGTIQEGAKLEDGVLRINVMEAPVSEVSVKYYGTDQNEVDEGRLNRSALEHWSPAQVGEVMNRKALDDFVNLLNLNPDRHVSPLISKGAEPNTLSLEYDVYEANPWHYFIQVDNSGTNDRQWAPRFGLINTNVLGIDDRFTAVYQAKPDSTIADNYSIYGTYDVPVMGPRLRLNVFGGHSEFDINPESGIFDFLGRGTFYGALLRYNLLQENKWFLDVTGTYSHERSKVTPSLFPTAASDVKMDLAGAGVELYRRSDMANTSLAFNWVTSIGGSSRQTFQLARTLADPDFSIYTLLAGHNQYIDQNKYHQLKSNFRWIIPDERLVPAKMTAFGGMYSVRGYDEYEFVADGGILASIQYEFDWLRYNEAVERSRAEADPNMTQPAGGKTVLTKLSPLLFMDYGDARVKDHVINEKSSETLWSVGVGAIIELGQNLNGACYYGYPLKATEDTRRGKGRMNVSFMLRW
jgi:hemolysin activation/secretion protein